MAGRTWIATLLLVLAAVCALFSARGDVVLRSQHSRPAIHLPEQMVVVTEQGKIFHRPGCKYIHGTPKTESAAQAAADGYTPCTRCLPELMQP